MATIRTRPISSSRWLRLRSHMTDDFQTLDGECPMRLPPPIDRSTARRALALPWQRGCSDGRRAVTGDQMRKHPDPLPVAARYRLGQRDPQRPLLRQQPPPRADSGCLLRRRTCRSVRVTLRPLAHANRDRRVRAAARQEPVRRALGQGRGLAAGLAGVVRVGLRLSARRAGRYDRQRTQLLMRGQQERNSRTGKNLSAMVPARTAHDEPDSSATRCRRPAPGPARRVQDGSGDLPEGSCAIVAMRPVRNLRPHRVLCDRRGAGRSCGRGICNARGRDGNPS